MTRVGLTGGVASGKSTVAAMLAELGAVVVDADLGAREVVAPGQPALEEIVAAFGPGVLQPDGSLDRQRLADLVFDDAEARARLNDITHPRVRAWMAERMRAAAAAGAEVVVLDIPLLYESGLTEGLDAVVVAYAPVEVQFRRAVDRGMEGADVRARIKAQLPIDQKRALATLVVDNSGSREQTRAAVEAAWPTLLGRVAPG
jgi:dephospho-CoA kinase